MPHKKFDLINLLQHPRLFQELIEAVAERSVDPVLTLGFEQREDGGKIRDKITPAFLNARLPLSFKWQRVKHKSASFSTPMSPQI